MAEDVNFNAYNSDPRKLSELRGILFLLCEELDLRPVEFENAATLKQWATGDGRADESRMPRRPQLINRTVAIAESTVTGT